MPDQGTGSAFLERVLRSGKKREGLLGRDVSGGVGMPDPMGMGGGRVPTPAPPSQEQVPKPVPRERAPVAERPRAAPQKQQQQTQAEPLPSLMQEFPVDTLPDADTQAPVMPATNLGERFYRRYGRPATDVDYYILHLREQFEAQMGRPPTKTELIASLRRSYQAREDRPI